MKFSLLSKFCLVAAAALVAVPAFALQDEGSWELGPFLSYTVFDEAFDNEIGFGGRVGYNLQNGHEFEITGQHIAPDLDEDVFGPGFDPDTDVWIWTIGYVYNFNRTNEITPFVTAGVGTAKLEVDLNGGDDIDESETTWYVGGGLRFFFTEDFQLRLDGRYTPVDTDPTLDNWQFMAGVSWNLGKR